MTVNLLIFFSVQLIFCSALYKLLYLREKELIIPLVIPFIDSESELGFYINMMHQLINASIGFFIIHTIEILTCVLTNNACVAAAVIENALLEFKIEIKKNKPFRMIKSCNFITSS